MQYAGLTWDNVQNVVLQELGAGNVAAATKIYDTYFAGEADTSDARSLVALVDKLDPGLVNDLVTKALDQIAKSAVRAIPQVVSMFLPGANAVRGLYSVLRWTLDNRVALGGVFTKIVDSINALAEGNVPNFRAQLLQAMNGAIDLKRITEYVPQKIDTTLRGIV